ncbi:MAG: DUF4861 domain-containing protein [Bacteroidaceae bacterium]|nr:DUF4861 domain-containing protein [Bacteroidaceae bacterium]
MSLTFLNPHKAIAIGVVIATSATISAQTLTFDIQNPGNESRKDVPVVLDLHELYKADAPRLTSVTITDVSTKAEIASQLDDLDGDLCFDEVAFTIDVPAQSAVRVECKASYDEPQRQYTPRVNAFMKVWDRKYRYPYINSIEYKGCNEPLATYDAIYGHGAQWESELVGFRIYIDHRQSIDLYGKPTPQLVLDQTNFYSTRDDLAAGRGEDILFVGASVGAGSFRGYLEGQPTYVDSVKARGQRVIAAGPVRTIVEVTDRGWHYGSTDIEMRQLYTMYAGHRDVQVDVQMRGQDAEQLFCTGVQKLESDNTGFLQEDGLAGSWGQNIPDKANMDLVEGVGMGVYVPAPYLHSIKEDSLNYLTIIKPLSGSIRYHLAVCAWMEQAGFKSSEEWFQWLHRWQDELQQPCTVVLH